jgi:hypothetical protein
MWDENGKPTAGMAKPIAYIDVTSRPLSSAFFNHLSESPLDLWKWGAKSRPARIDHDIPLRADFRPVQTERLANPALDTIAYD